MLFEPLFKWQVARRETLSKDDADASKANDNQGHSSNLSEERGEYSGNLSSDQVPTLAIHDKSVAESTLMISALTQGAGSEQLGEQGHKAGLDEVLRNGELGSPISKRKDVVSGKVEGKGNAVHKMNTLFSFGTRNQDDNLQKVRLFTPFNSSHILLH